MFSNSTPNSNPLLARKTQPWENEIPDNRPDYLYYESAYATTRP